jgi:excinuclease UvrABC nuclease subunit
MNVDITSLPRLPISERKNLPSLKGLYFVLGDGEIVYIGMTANFNKRFAQHHRLKSFITTKDVKIAWLQTDSEDLFSLEKEAISFFNPKLNGKRTATDDESGTYLTVKLPADLRREARLKSADTGVTLSFVIRKAIEAWVKEPVKK